ncbi:MAG: OmpH family outer membrane protein, partial [Flavipsychrobacter sp.]
LYLKTEKKKFEKRQADMMAELERSAQQIQNDYIAMQRKMQAGTLTPAEKDAGEKRLMQMEESYRTRKDALQVQLVKEQDEFNKKLQAELDAFLAEYNKDKKFDYILSYSKGGSIMFANKSLDITEDVLKGMNTRNPVVNEAEKKNK